MMHSLEAASEGCIARQTLIVAKLEESLVPGFGIYLQDLEICDLDMVLVATGRAPRTKGLGLEELGVKLSEWHGSIPWHWMAK